MNLINHKIRWNKWL